MADAVSSGKYSNIIIDRGAVHLWGKRQENLGYAYKQPDTNKYYSFLNPDLTTYNYLGAPTWWVYNINKSNLNAIVDIPNYSLYGAVEKLNLNYDLKKKSLRGLSIPGNLSKVDLVCNGETILHLENKDRAYDYIHLDSNGEYTAVKYINWNNEVKSVMTDGAIIMDQSLGRKLRQSAVTLFVPKDGKDYAKMLMSLKLNLPIDKVFMSTPYLLFNDNKKKNKIEISLYGVDDNNNQKKYYNNSIKSDGSGLFGQHTYMNGDEEYQSYDFLVSDFSGESNLNIEYLINGESQVGSIEAAIYSNFHGFERSLNYIVMHGKKTGLLGKCQDSELTIRADSESFKKISDLESYIGLTYSIE
jgi:hypothetical protein